MDKSKRLPDAELEVMQAVWSLEPPVTAAQVQHKVPSDWKATSVLTFYRGCATRAFFRAKRRDGRTCTRRA